MEDTIVAVASPPGQGAVSLIRISGKDSSTIASKVFRGINPDSLLKPRTQCFGEILNNKGEKVDSVLATFFKKPNSYTGEDTIEISCHGGMLITKYVLDTLIEAGARPAEPGEFSKRSFLNGKMDLTQAEAVMDLITAKTSLAMRAANSQLDGKLGDCVNDLKESTLNILAHIEAYIDFPEEDIAPETVDQIIIKLDELIVSVGILIDTSEQGRILREGLLLAIAGPPNAGKSSLMNKLLGYERAIVSNVAGTTRDTIEETANIRGVPIRLIDTAGLRKVDDAIEGEGVERAKNVIKSADLVLLVVDGSKEIIDIDKFKSELPDDLNHIVVINKNDLGVHQSYQSIDGIRISCIDELGIDHLSEAIANYCMTGKEAYGNDLIAVNSRHQSCLELSRKNLIGAKEGLINGLEPEYVALDVRSALNSIGEIVGQVDVEDLLGEIFGSFCIGK